MARSSATGEFRFETDCVGVPKQDVPALIKMIEEAVGVTRRTFLCHVHRGDLAELERALKYADHPARGMTMAADWHVRYRRSSFKGRRCYFFDHSGIEYIFTERKAS